MIKKNQLNHPVEKMCEFLKVSKSGYYTWLTRKECKHSIEDRAYLKLIVDIFIDSDGSYGSPRITDELRDQGHKVSYKRVARIMKENGINAIWKPKFKVKTTDSNHNLTISPNLLNQNFNIAKPNTAWVSDITYIRIGSRWAYLCVILDLFNREVVGYTLAWNMKASMVIEALHKAVQNKKPNSELIFHSDRGSQPNALVA